MSFWRTVRIFTVAALAYLAVYWVSGTQGVPAAIALVAATLVVAVGFLENNIRELWRRKQDRPRDEEISE